MIGIKILEFGCQHVWLSRTTTAGTARGRDPNCSCTKRPNVATLKCSEGRNCNKIRLAKTSFISWHEIRSSRWDVEIWLADLKFRTKQLRPDISSILTDQHITTSSRRTSQLRSSSITDQFRTFIMKTNKHKLGLSRLNLLHEIIATFLFPSRSFLINVQHIRSSSISGNSSANIRPQKSAGHEDVIL